MRQIHHNNIISSDCCFIVWLEVIGESVFVMLFIILSGAEHMDSMLIYDIESELGSEIEENNEIFQAEFKK